MPVQKKKTVKRNEIGLKRKQLDYTVDYAPAKVKSSDDIEPCCYIIGQDRAVESIKTGLAVKSRGYNIFVTGPAGTGRTTTIKHLLQQLDLQEPVLKDICYVNNFKNPDNPKVLLFAAGDGRTFKRDMGYLIASLRKIVPKIFMSEDYKDRHSRIVREFEGRQKELIHSFEEKLSNSGFVMVQIQSGVGVRNEIQPLIEEEPSSFEKLERLEREGKFSLSKLDELRRAWDSLRREFDLTTVESKKLSTKLEDAIEKLNFFMVAPMVTDKINLLKKRFPVEKVTSYLDEVQDAMLEDLSRFSESQPRRGEEEAPPYRKQEPFEEFSVNLIVDNGETENVPIIIEKSPSYKKLFGSLERVVDRFGYWRTDFTRIFGGSLLKASGGFLVANAIDLLIEPGVWTQLKRTLLNGELEITGFDPFNMFAGSGIKPEPIPMDIKVVLKGDSRVFSLLLGMDEDFKKIFKIKAEFDSVFKANKTNYRKYFEFISRAVKDNELLPFDLGGMQAVIEYGKKMAGRRDELTTRFTLISDIVREASYCATQKKRKQVTRDDVYCAIKLKRQRSSLIEDKVQERYDDKTILVSTSRKAVGQINALAVYATGDYTFGRPSRITANTSLGRAGVINIEREADLSGPTHNKGVLILSGYLRQMFAQDKPLAMSASISFEQSYSGVDGDSASSTEIYAILSSLTGIPINQGLAVTGSVNQKGEIQPIGGVNEKIEGFYDVCKARRLTGKQGVLIPHQNVKDLMLRPDVIESVDQGNFSIYPVKDINQGIEILTGVKAGRLLSSGKFTPGSVMDQADRKLHEMAMTFQNFGRTNDEPKNGSTKKKKRSATGKRKKR
ncbi:MAG: ATP-binding protein [bacterium]|nr:ATP-binding protein [bacterium]